MSVIVHRCRGCGHPDIWHVAAGGQTYCDLSERFHVPVWGDPEVIDTWSYSGELAPLRVPGSPLGAGFHRAACSCSQCQELYREMSR